MPPSYLLRPYSAPSLSHKSTPMCDGEYVPESGIWTRIYRGRSRYPSNLIPNSTKSDDYDADNMSAYKSTSKVNNPDDYEQSHCQRCGTKGGIGGKGIGAICVPMLVRKLESRKMYRQFLFGIGVCFVIALPYVDIFVSSHARRRKHKAVQLQSQQRLQNDKMPSSLLVSSLSYSTSASSQQPQHQVSTSTSTSTSPYQASKIAGVVVNMIDSLNLQENGEDWQAWNRIDVIGDPTTECHLSPFIPSNAVNVKSTPADHNYRGGGATICLHPVEEDILVSTAVREVGRWKDCDRLSSKWNELAANNELGPNPIYVEIGANIGTCVMEMLLATNADIVVFESLPSNVALLTQTLLLNGERLRNRVKLYPIALDQVGPGNIVIASRKNQAGNLVMVMGATNILKAKEETSDPIPIRVEKLDDIFSQVNLAGEDDYNGIGANPIVSIPLMKLDVDGYECRVLSGGKRVLESTVVLKTETVRTLLRAQGCSSKALNKIIVGAGLEMVEKRGEEVVYAQKVQLVHEVEGDYEGGDEEDESRRD